MQTGLMPAFPPGCALKYRAVRLLGSGGFGSVVLANQVALDRQVVIKLLHVDSSAEPDRVERFVSEARVTASLQHPNIVVLLDFDIEDGTPWICYEYVPGEDLRHALRRGPMKLSDALLAAAQVASALELAHGQEILHRDIKPENVLQMNAALWKVADFGLAKWRGSNAVRTQEGIILGTPAYMAPELIRGKPASPASDLYALGILLHELIAGRPPFESESVPELLQMHLREASVPVGQLRPGVPEGLEALVAELLAKEPSARPSSAGEVKRRLERLATAPAPLEATATRTVRMRRAPEPVSSRATHVVATSAAAQNSPPGRRFTAGAAALALTATALVAAAFWPARPPPPTVASPTPPSPRPSPPPAPAAVLPRPARPALGPPVKKLTPTERVERLQDELSRDRKNWRIYLELAQAREADWNWNKAADDYAYLALKASGVSDDIRLQANLGLGRTAPRRLAWADATGAYRRALRASPGNLEALRGLGELLRKVPASRSEAIRLLETAAKQDTSDLSTRRSLGLALVEEQRRGDAIPHLEAVAAQRGDDLEVRRMLGLELANIGRCKDAEPYLLEALDKNGEDLHAILALGACQEKAGLLQEAEMTYRRARSRALDGRLAGVMNDQGRLDEAIALYRSAAQGEPRNLDWRVSLSRLLQRRLRDADAEAEIRKAIQIDSNHTAALLDLGGLRFRAGDLDTAAKLYARVLVLEPANPDAASFLAEVRERQGNLAEAIELNAKVYRSSAQRFETARPLSRQLLAAGRAREAEELLGQVSRAHPEATWAAGELAKLLTQQGRVQQARAVLAAAGGVSNETRDARRALIASLRTVDDHAGVERELRAVLRETPADARLLAELGDALSLQGRHTEAFDAYGRSVAARPDDLVLLLRIAELARGKGEKLLAESAFRQAIRLDPANPQGHMSLAHVLASTDRASEAEHEYLAAARNPVWKAEALTHAARLAQARADLTSAEAHLRQAVETDPRSGPLRTELAQLLVRAGKQSEALAEFERAIDCSDTPWFVYPELADLLEGRGELDRAFELLRRGAERHHVAQLRVSLATRLRDRGRTAEAIPELRAALALEPTHPTARRDLAGSLRASRQTTAALAELSQHLRAHPEDPEACWLHGQLLEDTGQPDGAERAYRLSIEKQPANAPAQVLLGALLRRRGRRPDGTACLKRAIESDPNASWAHLAYGTALREDGNLPGAIASFREATRLDPSSAAAEEILGDTLLQAGRRQQAATAYAHAARLDPANLDLRRKLASLEAPGAASPPRVR
ncbi:MAG: tetratricopeptide repeat protein [Candidatus Wallbacteria bacterium]|nr:tetratricopeptide repeat protein [Candidatus Wallbacteria bacterium]